MPRINVASNVEKLHKCPRCKGSGFVPHGRRKKAIMKSEYQAIIDATQRASDLDDAKDQQILDLQAQLAALKPKSVTLANIQTSMPETLWYEARSPNAPKSGPHGTVTITPGSPATADFHPVNLGGQSDNCYNLFRLYPQLTADQKSLLETATQFSISCDYLFDPLASVQAGELDYQIRKSSGVVINVGPQLLPIPGGWSIRGFDYVRKVWVPLGVKAAVIPTKPTHLEVYATCDDKTVQFTRVVVDGISSSTSFSHPVSQSATSQPYCNAAYQLDATADGKPYRAQINNLTVTFG
jgi:hypothetical protein